MRTFNNEMPGDIITLEMRVKEDVRHVLRAMFISSEDKKKMLEESLEMAISKTDILSVIEKYATEAIHESVKEYFSSGEGGTVLRKSINDVLHEVIPNIFCKDIR